MSQHNDDQDEWNLEAIKLDHAPYNYPALSNKIIENVEPLDDQFGESPVKTAPDALYSALFEQPEPTEPEIDCYGSADAVPPKQTYAILDAAKVINLPEMLDASSLEHRCLFKGEAYDELKNVAPWIVRLEIGNKFTRHLFTRGNAGWHMWDKEPGIYLRSRRTLDDLWQHFRKFTRVQDEDGMWYYFRFWEKITMAALENELPTKFALALLNDGSASGLMWMAVWSETNTVVSYEIKGDPRKIMAEKLRISAELFDFFDSKVAEIQDDRDIKATLERLSLDDDTTDLPDQRFLRSALRDLRNAGFSTDQKRQDALRLYIEAALRGKRNAASDILKNAEQTPAIRLWHLKNLVGGNAL